MRTLDLGPTTKARGGHLQVGLEGLRRLRNVGPSFSQNQAWRRPIGMVELSSPVTAFVQDTCRLGTDLVVAKRMLYEEWRRWCVESGHEFGSQITFGRNLMAAFPEIQTVRPRERRA